MDKSILERVNEYFEHSYIGQSTLKNFWKEGIYGRYDNKRKKHFILGNLIECLLTYKEDFNDFFHIVDINIPSDNIQQLFSYIIENDLTIEDYDSWKEKADELDWYNTKETRRIPELNKKLDYYAFLLEVQDKTLVSKKEYTEAENLVFKFKNSSVYEKHILPLYELEKEGKINMYYQVPYYCDSLKGKCLYDWLICCHEDVYILGHHYKEGDYINLDLKTSSNIDHPKDWSYIARKFGYDKQSAWYREVPKNSFTVAASYNLVIPTNICEPFLYKFNEDDLDNAYYGNEEYNYKGMLDYYQYYMWHSDRDFSEDQLLFTNDYILTTRIWN